MPCIWHGNGRRNTAMTDFFDLYNALIQGIDSQDTVTGTLLGQCWTAVET